MNEVIIFNVCQYRRVNSCKFKLYIAYLTAAQHVNATAKQMLHDAYTVRKQSLHKIHRVLGKTHRAAIMTFNQTTLL